MSRPADYPAYMGEKRLAGNKIGYRWVCPVLYRKMGYPIRFVALGSSYETAAPRARELTEELRQWVIGKRAGTLDERVAPTAPYGSVEWMKRTYLTSDGFAKKVKSAEGQASYRRMLDMITDIPLKDGRRFGALMMKQVSGAAADKVYAALLTGGKRKAEGRYRTANLATDVLKRAWKVVTRLHPDVKNPELPNPWEGVTREGSTKRKEAVTRDEAYAGAEALAKDGYPELAAAAIICFEFLQRPTNVLAGYIRWTDYRPEKQPSAIHIEHHKTGELCWHPLDGPSPLDPAEQASYYAEAEEIIKATPRRGIPIVMRQRPGNLPAELWDARDAAKVIRKTRAKHKLSAHWTLDACRHGGMTELEEIGLTEGEGMALSGHQSPQAFRRYPKKTLMRALGPTMKRFAWRNAPGTEIQPAPVRNIQPNSRQKKTGEKI